MYWTGFITILHKKKRAIITPIRNKNHHFYPFVGGSKNPPTLGFTVRYFYFSVLDTFTWQNKIFPEFFMTPIKQTFQEMLRDIF